MKRCRVKVHLEGLGRNIRALRDAMLPQTQIIFVVKSNAYGHGLGQTVERAYAEGVRWFAVAYLHEAVELRGYVSDAEVLILGTIEADDVDVVAAQRLTPVVMSIQQARWLSSAAVAANLILKIHVKMDTGMGRLGLAGAHALDQLAEVLTLPGLQVEGICSHFATVEPRRPELAQQQYDRFVQAADFAEEQVGKRLFRHLSSSRAIQFHREWDLDGIRPGILLYGYGSGELGMRIRTEPWLEWVAYGMQAKTVPENTPVGYYASYHTPRETDIATICVGYADGFLRSLSNEGFVLIGGVRRPVVGRISMNWVTVDLGPDSGVQEGDEVVLVGRQQGDALWADEIARWAGTIAYETLTAISPHIQREYE